MSDLERTLALPPFPELPTGTRIVHIANAVGYAASDDGVIWSCHIAAGKGGIGDNWRSLRPNPDKDGYLSVAIREHGKRITRKVAHLILEAFVGPRPRGAESCHFPDTSPCNNRHDNLRWGTHQENIDDKIALNTVARGERHGGAILDASSVIEMRRLRSAGESLRELATRFGISRCQVSAIVLGQAWSHIKEGVLPKRDLPATAQLSKEDVLRIVSDEFREMAIPDVARYFGVRRHVIWNLRKGVTWSRVTGIKKGSG